MRILQRVACGLMLGTLFACAGMRQDLSDIAVFQTGLAETFKGQTTTLTISNGTVLKLEFTSDGTTTVPDSERVAVARSAAEYVRDHYAGYGRLRSVEVSFKEATKLGGVSVTKSSGPHTFTVSELGPPVASDAKAKP